MDVWPDGGFFYDPRPEEETRVPHGVHELGDAIFGNPKDKALIKVQARDIRRYVDRIALLTAKVEEYEELIEWKKRPAFGSDLTIAVYAAALFAILAGFIFTQPFVILFGAALAAAMRLADIWEARA